MNQLYFPLTFAVSSLHVNVNLYPQVLSAAGNDGSILSAQVGMY